jgi:hypothetical protein
LAGGAVPALTSLARPSLVRSDVDVMAPGKQLLSQPKLLTVDFYRLSEFSHAKKYPQRTAGIFLSKAQTA